MELLKREGSDGLLFTGGEKGSVDEVLKFEEELPGEMHEWFVIGRGVPGNT